MEVKKMTNYIPTIGIEVHVELKTNTKIFSNSINGYGQMANSLTNVVDLGYPGTLPTVNKEVINLPDIAGLKEWHSKTDIYDPYTSHTEFQIDGFEDWVNEGYRFAMQIRKLLPDYVSLYYGFWHNFGDNEWRYCKSLITK